MSWSKDIGSIHTDDNRQLMYGVNFESRILNHMFQQSDVLDI
jgi:hypothetical protein